MPARLTVPLLPHPTTPCSALDAIVVAVSRCEDGGLALAYHLHGRLDELRLPPAVTAARTDGLWQHTCCEVFVAARGSDPLVYREINFSPSGAWAAYAFCGPRRRRPAADPVFAAAPAITVARRTAADGRPVELCLTATLPAAVLPCATGLDLGLSVVIENQRGEHSYWALCHPAQRPDFHHREAFALSMDSIS